MLRCGIHESNITPALGSEMPGYFELRKADGVKDELFSEAVYFENGDEKAVIISNDVIQLPMESCDRARAAVSARLGVKPENVLFCATHSHTAGPVETWGDFVHIDPKYIEFLESRLIDGAVMAAADARDVRIGFAKTMEDKLAYYRNFIGEDGTAHTWGKGRPFGEIDPEVCILRIDNADGGLYGMIVNYSCHCDCVGGKQFSADYPGEMRAALRRMYGDRFMPVFINGFCGNINHVDQYGFNSEVPQHYKRMGRMLAADASRAFEMAVHWFEDESIAGAMTVMEIGSRVPEKYHLDLAEKTENDLNASEREIFYAKEIRKSEKQGRIVLPVPVQVIRIGDFAVFGMPGEIYVEFAGMIKKGSPIKYSITANLSNGAYGYVPIRELFQPGIYEASVGMSNRLDPEAGYMMTDELLRLAEDIK